MIYLKKIRCLRFIFVLWVLVNYFFTGNAEMSDLFKCKKPGTKCCAPKSSIKEIMDKNDGDLSEKESVTQSTTITYAPPTSKVVPIGTSTYHVIGK